MRYAVALLMAVAVAGVAGWFLMRAPAALPSSSSIDLRGALSDDSGRFATVLPGRPFSFPRDHGEHPEFKTEWWYFTGNLHDTGGLPYGYQLTFFRSGLPLPEASPLSPGPWDARDVIMAHLAVSDPDQGKFTSYERFSRRALGLAGVTVKEGAISVWLEDWRMERTPQGQWELRAAERLPDGSPLSLSLRLDEAKPPVLQGRDGYSRKGPAPEQASYYVSLTRLRTAGELVLGKRRLTVEGLSWFDHEWSSSAMAPGLVGWDWFSLQLDDGWDLMLYSLRYSDGRLEPASSGSLVAPNGEKTPLSLADYTVTVEDHHTSPQGVSYPSAWTVSLPKASLRLRVRPRLLDQEMASGVKYWEGAVTVEGERDARPIGGSGFVEMTGYGTDKSF